MSIIPLYASVTLSEALEWSWIRYSRLRAEVYRASPGWVAARVEPSRDSTCAVRGGIMTALADRLAAQAAAKGLQELEGKRIRLATYNIQSGRAGRLEMALRAMEQMNVDIGILTEAKLTDGVHTRYSSGYHVYATAAVSHHQGGVALFFRESRRWQVESIKRYGPNVISFEIAMGHARFGVVGAYVPPSDDDGTALEFVNQAMDGLPRGCQPLLLGDLNADLSNPRDGRAQAVAADMASHALEDLLLHFRQRRGFRHGATWRQRRNDELVSSRCDYILGRDRRILANVSVRNPRLFASDHLLVLGELRSESQQRHSSYLRGRKRFPLRLPKWGPLTQADARFQTLLDAIPVPTRAERRARREWISQSTWKLVDERSALQKVVDHDRAHARRLTRRIRRAFQADRKQRAKAAGEAVAAALSAGEVKEAWKRLQAWYKQASDRPPPPSRQDLRAVTAERADLYRKENPPGDPIPVLVDPFPVSDAVPSEGEVEAAVRRLSSGKSPGPSGLRMDHLKQWLRAARRKDNPDSSTWDNLVELVQYVYEHGQCPTSMTFSTVVLLPKPDGGVRGIGLLEAVWKLLASIIDLRMKAQIRFHDSLHGSVPGRGTGTAVFEAKLFQQLAAVEQVPVFEIFLDLKKAYDCVDRERTLDILEQYGVGPRALRLLRQFWEQQVIVARQGGYHGEPFKATRGIVQGDAASPTIFIVVVDAIVRYWLSLTVDDGSEHDGLGLMVKERLVLFFVDDGLIAARNHEWLQMAIAKLSELFERVGLRTNIQKTKAMTCTPGYISSQLSSPAYKRRQEGGESYRERKRRRVTCSHCGLDLAAGSLGKHLRVQHGLSPDTGVGYPDAPGRQPAEHRISFPRYVSKVACPVEGCPGTATTRSNLRKHFAHRHFHDSLVILEEGSRPLPKCELCGMHVPRMALAAGHHRSQLCRDGAQRVRQRNAAEDARLAREVVFSIHGEPLESVSVFTYLGRPLSSTDDDWPAIYKNISTARKRWARISRVLAREGADPGVSAMFYKAVVQSVLLYGCETWVVTPAVLRVLSGFHHRVARRLTGKRGRYLHHEDRWVYPPIDEVLQEAKMYSIEHYINVRRDTLIQRIATRPILELCRGAERQSGSPNRTFWWSQVPDDME